MKNKIRKISLKCENLQSTETMKKISVGNLTEDTLLFVALVQEIQICTQEVSTRKSQHQLKCQNTRDTYSNLD